MTSFIILLFTILVLINPKLVASKSRRCQRRNLSDGPQNCPTVKCQPRKCDKVICPKIACLYGFDYNDCGCCPSCLKGPGECCGGPGGEKGRCTEGFYCSDTNYEPILRDDLTAFIGSCRSNSCPDCNLVDCRPKEMLNCAKGTKLDPFCKCCRFCLKGLGETCGRPSSVEGVCEEGLTCEIAPGRPVFQEGPDPPVGTCNEITFNPPTYNCPEMPNECANCAVALCLSDEGSNCEFGTTIDPVCGCCPVCLLGPGESCGGFRSNPTVECGIGLRCQIENIDLPDASGTCVPIEEIQ